MSGRSIEDMMEQGLRMHMEHGTDVRCPRCNAGTGKFCRDDAGVRVLHSERVRVHELQPLADALAIMVRGATDARVEQTGGDVYCAVAMFGFYEVAGDEYGWSITDTRDGTSHSWGVWFDDEQARPLTVDPDTGALDAGECEAAAHTFGAALPVILA